jgi:hypothetical protein
LDIGRAAGIPAAECELELTGPRGGEAVPRHASLKCTGDHNDVTVAGKKENFLEADFKGFQGVVWDEDGCDGLGELCYFAFCDKAHVKLSKVKLSKMVVEDVNADYASVMVGVLCVGGAAHVTISGAHVSETAGTTLYVSHKGSATLIDSIVERSLGGGTGGAIQANERAVTSLLNSTVLGMPQTPADSDTWGIVSTMWGLRAVGKSGVLVDGSVIENIGAYESLLGHHNGGAILASEQSNVVVRNSTIRGHWLKEDPLIVSEYEPKSGAITVLENAVMTIEKNSTISGNTGRSAVFVDGKQASLNIFEDTVVRDDVGGGLIALGNGTLRFEGTKWINNTHSSALEYGGAMNLVGPGLNVTIVESDFANEQ